METTKSLLTKTPAEKIRMYEPSTPKTPGTVSKQLEFDSALASKAQFMGKFLGSAKALGEITAVQSLLARKNWTARLNVQYKNEILDYLVLEITKIFPCMNVTRHDSTSTIKERLRNNDIFIMEARALVKDLKIIY